MNDEQLVPITEAKTKLFGLVHECEKHDIFVLRHGRPVAVLVEYDRWKRVVEELDNLQDQVDALQIERAE